MVYPKLLDILIDNFKKFPGIGEKSAERMALSLLERDADEVSDFASSMVDAKQNLRNCIQCGALTDEEMCDICMNENRDHNCICVVEDYKSMLTFEKMGRFNGIYHILDGVISPIDGIGPDDINLDSLIKKCKKNDNEVEIIIALKPSIEGETTTLFLDKMLNFPNVKITRLSYGLPIGTDIEYIDGLTLEKAFEDRKELDS